MAPAGAGLALLPELLIIDWCDYHWEAGGYSSDPSLLQKDRVNFSVFAVALSTGLTVAGVDRTLRTPSASPCTGEPAIGIDVAQFPVFGFP